jgi:predicted nucleic acid-binding protein
MTAFFVTDTTALIVLGKQQRLDLLGACFERVLLPPAVYAEWLAGDAAIVSVVDERDWLEVTTPDDRPLLTELRGLLDAGEAEAMMLAKQHGLPLLVDEKKGRNMARMMGIPVLGLVGVLLLAVQRQLLTTEAATAILQRARDDGFRLSDRLHQAFS